MARRATDSERRCPFPERSPSSVPRETTISARSVWLLSQVGTDEAFDMLVEMARNDPDAEVRGQALFWVGQSPGHSEQAMDLLIDILQSTDDEETRARGDAISCP